MGVAGWSGSVLGWDRQLRSLKERIGPVFGRREVRETAGAFVDGLLAGVERKTGWLLSEAAGVECPTACSRFSAAPAGMRMTCGM